MRWLLDTRKIKIVPRALLTAESSSCTFLVVKDSFEGGVQVAKDRRGKLRAQVALVGSNVEALTGKETFRIPLTRCEMLSEGARVVLRDLDGSLTIWSDDAPFLDALERTRYDALRHQAGRIRTSRRRRRILTICVRVLVAVAVILVINVPLTRWAVGGGVPPLSNHIGQSVLQQLHLESVQAPMTDQRLAAMAKPLQPAASLGKHALRILLAPYNDVHTFHMPPNAVIVTSELLCRADDPDVVAAAVALELAHLEAGDMIAQMSATVDAWTSLTLLSGDTTQQCDYLLNFVDSRRTPGYTSAQKEAANKRAMAILGATITPPMAEADIIALIDRAKQLHTADRLGTGAKPPGAIDSDASREWLKVREEACGILDGQAH